MQLNNINYITCENSPNQKMKFFYKMELIDFFQDLDIYKYNVPKEEHDLCLKKIINAIAYNRKGFLTKVDLVLFAKAYPESMNYVNDYINVFFDEIVKDDKEIRDKNYSYAYRSKQNSEVFWLIRKNIERKILSMLFFDYLIDKDVDVRLKTIKTLGLNKKTYYYVIETMSSYLGIDITEFYKNLKEQNVLNAELEKKDTSSKSRKNFQGENSEELFNKLELIINYLKDGIIIDDKKISFTNLDFRSLVDLQPRDFFYKIRCLSTKDNLEIIDIKLLEKYCLKHYEIARLKSPEELVKKSGNYILGGITYKIDEELAEYLFKLYEENGIPTTFSLLEIGAKRVFRNEPVLPIIELAKQQELGGVRKK